MRRKADSKENCYLDLGSERVKNWMTVVRKYINQGIRKKKPSHNQYHSYSISHTSV